MHWHWPLNRSSRTTLLAGALCLAADQRSNSLVMRNTEDFTGIDGLEVISPWLPR